MANDIKLIIGEYGAKCAHVFIPVPSDNSKPLIHIILAELGDNDTAYYVGMVKRVGRDFDINNHMISITDSGGVVLYSTE